MNIRGAPATYDDLSAVYVNCTLKRSPTISHTQYLLDHSATIMARAGASVTQIRAVDHDIAFGMSPDMADLDPDAGGVEDDDWPSIERLYSWSGEENDKGQYLGRPRRLRQRVHHGVVRES